MNILITNDDGIFAPGLRALVDAVKSLGTVRVVAPDREQSASGHSITLHKPLRMDAVKLDGVEAYSSNGTPADCVILGCLTAESPPDLVLSGINRGANLGEEVLYSGTVSAAMEAAIQGLKSVALSVASYTTDDFRAAARVGARLVEVVPEIELPGDCFLNVNVPPVLWGDIQGVVVTRLGKREYINRVDRREDPRGRAYYWFSGSPRESSSGEGTDIGAVAENKISITPVHFDLTGYETMEVLGGLAGALAEDL
ncbi:MAG: 5'/3'-nucleotidase SurE [candidate division WS1 bacterium]|jgi:5'-nucleotidase|nr:5'/3'-nucleotidase SurE [candidate division WS1 bacterium]